VQRVDCGKIAAMSRSIARFVTALVKTTVAPLSARQRKRVISRVIDALMTDDLAEVDTRLGKLRFRQLRSAFTASAVDRFHTDEPETLAWIDGFEAGASFWDIGASIGVYSLYAALKPGVAVLAFEPSGFNFGVLVEHVALNGMGELVQPFCVAIGLQRQALGALHMSQASPGHGGNALDRPENQYTTFDAVFRQRVLAFSIDGFREAYGLPAPTHIKIDVDGIEDDIIAGATGTLPAVESVLIEVQGRIEGERARTMETTLAAAGLVEDGAARALGSGRNRLYRRRA
jgi:FkbM family methyltransferase